MGKVSLISVRLLSAPIAHQVRGASLYVRRSVRVELSLPKDLRAVTEPGLFRKRLKTHFLVWLSVCWRYGWL